MCDQPEATPVRPNLWADRLTSYAFGVQTAIGQKPMHYVVARRFQSDPPTRALTLLFVIRPEILFGTYVRIDESILQGTCEVHTFLPTMARPLRVAERLVFDCVPLTDVGYVDLMAWLPPGLEAGGPDDLVCRDRDGAQGASARTFSYRGSADTPTLSICEDVDRRLSMVTVRTVYSGDRQIRRWEITEGGESAGETLPRRIRVSRPQTRHTTEFIRTAPPMHVPPEIFDETPEILREWIGSH